MFIDTITFNNKKYKIREIELPELGNIRISTVDLNDNLLIDGSRYISEEARNMDEEIYFFVEENEIESREEELVDLLRRQVL